MDATSSEEVTPKADAKQPKMSSFFKSDKKTTKERASISSSKSTYPLKIERILYDWEDDAGKKHFFGEGRTIIVETNQFMVVGVYVVREKKCIILMLSDRCDFTIAFNYTTA
jgi:hypothetical protein